MSFYKSIVERHIRSIRLSLLGALFLITESNPDEVLEYIHMHIRNGNKYPCNEAPFKGKYDFSWYSVVDMKMKGSLDLIEEAKALSSRSLESVYVPTPLSFYLSLYFLHLEDEKEYVRLTNIFYKKMQRAYKLFIRKEK